MAEKPFELDVTDVVEETPDACSISLLIPDSLREAFAYRPGQFLTVAVPSVQIGTVARCYSISSSPESSEAVITVTVKRTADGYASNWLCDNIRKGGRLTVLPPAGSFTPRSWESEILLFAAGSGITPIMSILRSALRRGTAEIALFYANRDIDSVIFRAELQDLATTHPDRFVMFEWLESERGMPTSESIAHVATPRACWDTYCCGPTPFMSLTTETLVELGFPPSRRHVERFISLSANPFLSADASENDDDGSDGADRPSAGTLVQLEAEIDGKIHAFSDWPPDMTLLEFFESKRLKVPSSCREGECSACSVLLVEGEVTMKSNEVLDEDDLAEGIRLACQSRPTTTVVKVAYE